MTLCDAPSRSQCEALVYHDDGRQGEKMDAEFDFQTFLNSLDGLSYVEIKLRAESKHAEMRPLSEMRSREKRNGEEVRVSAARMRARMADLLFWLDTGTRPAGMPIGDFLRMEPVCKALVARGEFKSAAALDIFTRARAEIAR
jgi:hypothetical protein